MRQNAKYAAIAYSRFSDMHKCGRNRHTSVNVKRLKVCTLAIVLLTRVRLKNSSALQYQKWQLIGMR